MYTDESTDRRPEAAAVNRHVARVGAYTFLGTGFRTAPRRLFGTAVLYLIPLFCLVTAVTARNPQAAVLGIEILVGLLLLQDRWGLRRRTPWLNSERKAVAMLAWAVLLGLGAAALWATSA